MMMTTRRGLGKGMGCGYKNLVYKDPYIHGLSAKGVTTYLKVRRPDGFRMKVPSNLARKLIVDEGYELLDAKGFFMKNLPIADNSHFKGNFNAMDWGRVTVNPSVLFKMRGSANVYSDFDATKDNLDRVVYMDKGVCISNQEKYKEEKAPIIDMFYVKDGKVVKESFQAKGKDWVNMKNTKLDSKSCDIVAHLKHSKVPDSKFDKKELNKGIKVEMEHTRSKKVAKAIAKAHLTESKDYYKKLAKMEKTLNASKNMFAETILQQLGGRRFMAMTGAKDFWHYDDKNQMGFRIGRNSKSINMVRITHNAKDLYDVEFLRVRGMDVKVVNKVTDVYNDQLQEVFTENTGLYTSL
jgi:glycerol-3-phosphate cytidylyltransferase-like family protein